MSAISDLPLPQWVTDNGDLLLGAVGLFMIGTWVVGFVLLLLNAGELPSLVRSWLCGDTDPGKQ